MHEIMRFSDVVSQNPVHRLRTETYGYWGPPKCPRAARVPLAYYVTIQVYRKF